MYHTALGTIFDVIIVHNRMINIGPNLRTDLKMFNYILNISIHSMLSTVFVRPISYSVSSVLIIVYLCKNIPTMER